MTSNIKISNVRLNKYDRLKVAAMSKNLFNETDWRTSITNGTAEQYTAALMKSSSINPDDFYKKYNLYYGNPETRLSALYNEVGADKTKVNTYQMPVFDASGNYVYDEQGKQLFDEVQMTEYDYNKKMLSESNSIYALREEANRKEKQRQVRMNFLGDVGSIIGQFGTAVAGGIEGIGALAFGTLEEISETGGQFLKDFLTMGEASKSSGKNYLDYLKGDESYAQTINKWYTDYSINDEMQSQLDQFAYNYSHFYDENGEMTTAGRWLTGIADTIGRLLPSALLATTTGGIGAALTTKAQMAGNLTSKTGSFLTSRAGTIGQLAFYGSNVFGSTVSDQYEYYASQGISISSSEIVANALVKSTLQMAVERGLGKLFGATGVDNLFWGTSTKTNVLRFSNKNLTKAAFGRLAKDALQEGTEEVLQETSDWFVDAAHHFINHDFQSTEWNWQNIADAFIVATIVSLGGSAGRIIGTKRVASGDIKTDKEGNLIKNDKGEYEFEKLGKIASYEYGLDLQSFMESVSSIENANKKIVELYRSMSEEERANSKQVQKAISEYEAAYYQALGSFQLLSGLYGEMGKERFNKANEILTKIREAQDEGVFDENLRKEAQKTLVDKIWYENDKFAGYVSGIGRVATDYKNEISRKIVEAEITKAVKNIDKNTDDEDKLSKEAKEIIKDLEDDLKVVVTKDGKMPIKVANILMVPQNLLEKAGAKVVIASIAEQELADELARGVLTKSKYFKNEVGIITDLYRQWSNDEKANEQDAIYNLIFDTTFFEVVLAINERTTSSFAIRLNGIIDKVGKAQNLKDTLLIKRVEECRKRWIEAAFNYYSNNLDKDTSLFTKNLSAEERKDFENRLNKLLQLYNMGAQIVTDPNKVSDDIWSFVERRIDGLDVDKNKKDELKRDIRANEAKRRQETLNFINARYDGMFNTLYNGKVYMPKTSVANYAFNTWLETNNLTISTMLNADYFTEEDLGYLGSNYSLDDVIALRISQFEEARPGSTFEITSNGNIVVKSELSDDGFDIYKDIINKNLNAIETGKSFKIDDKDVERKIVTDLKSIGKWIKNYLRSDIVEDDAHEWLTIDDIINHYEYLNDAVQEDIRNEYGSLNRISCYRYFQRELCSETDGKQSLVMKQDGTVVIGNMTAMTSTLKKTDIPTEGTFNINQFVNAKYLIGSLANVKVVLTYGSENKTRYADYENVDGVMRFTNTIYINTKINDSQEQRKFALLHEFQHAIQSQNRLNAGISSNILQYFNSKEKQEIINTVKELSPELFEGVTKQETIERFVNNYIYHASGEFQAMGLGGIGDIGFYPVIVSRRNGTTKITFKNGKSFEVKAAYSIIDAAQNIVDQSREIRNKYYSKYNVEQDTAMNWSRKGKALQNLRSELQNRNKTKDDELLEMYYLFNSNKTQKEFENSQVIGVEINGKKYTLKSLVEWENLINNVLKDERITESKMTVNLFVYKPKDLKSFRALYQIGNSYSFGEIKIDKSYISNRRNIVIDLDERAKEISEQSLIAENAYHQIEDYDENDTDGISLVNFDENTQFDIPSQELAQDTTKTFEKEKAPVETTTKAETTEAKKPIKVENKVIDKRPKSERKKAFKYDSKKYDHYRTPITKSKNAIKIISAKDIDKDVLETGNQLAYDKGGKYIYRKFVERRYYKTSTGEIEAHDIFDYYSPKSEERRYTTKPEIEDTNLKYFAEAKGKSQISLNPGLKDFIIASTDVEIDPVLMKKIKSGTLTSRDLIDYIIETPAADIDNTTFHLICKKYFKNDSFKNAFELQDIVLNQSAKMTALYLVLKDTDLKDLLEDELTDNELERIWQIANSDKRYTKELNRIYQGYSFNSSLRHYSPNQSYEGLDSTLLEKEGLYGFLRFYNKTISSGSLAAIRARTISYKANLSDETERWNSIFKQDVKTVSFEASAGGDLTIGEKLADDEDIEQEYIESFVGTEYDNILNELSDVTTGIGLKVFNIIANKILNSEVDNKAIFAQNVLTKYKTNIENLSEEQVRTLYDEVLNEIDENTVLKIYYLAGLGGNADTLTKNEFTEKHNLKEKADKIINTGSRVQGIKRQLKTIQKYVVKKSERDLVLKDNSDILNADLTIKESAYKTKDGYRDNKTILELKERINQIAKNAKNDVYKTQSNYNDYLRAIKKQIDTISSILKFAKKGATGKIKYTPFTIETNDDDYIRFETKEQSEVPQAIRQILSVGLTRTGRSKIQELSEYHEKYNEDGSVDKVYDDKYLKLTMTHLLKENAELLNDLSQDEAEEILNFYVNDNIIVADVDSQVVSETVRLVAAYLLGESRNPQEIRGENWVQTFDRFDFDEALIKRVEAKMMEQAHMSATMLSNQRTIIRLLQPHKVIAQELAKNLGFKLDDVDEKNLDDMLTYMRLGKQKEYKEARERFESKLIKDYPEKSKQDFIDKLLTFERAMMLSNPGTWVRNIASNYIVEGGNITSYKTGKVVTDLMMKVFPKFKGKLETDEGYKLDKKASDNTVKFINEKFVNNGLLDEIIEGVSKYDDLSKRESSSDSIIDMVARSIHGNIRRTQVFKNTKSGKVANKVIALVYKAINDDPWVKRTTKRYLGQIIEEDYQKAKKVAASKGKSLTYEKYLEDDKTNMYGLSKNIVSAFIKAVDLASYDYMKTTNFITQMERAIRENVPKGAWFIYKQVFPFLSSSWNWCVEGMRYTPAGLASAIIKLAKLEHTVQVMDDARSKGKSIVSGEFAKYLQIRNIGKGTIGTLTLAIGLLLAGLGWAGIDEEDDEYKLFVGDIKVNINDVLGTQGIMLGIAIGQNIANDGKDVVDVFAEAFNQLFRDSIFQDFIDTFRYDTGFGDFMWTTMWDIPTQFWPNILKTLASIVHHRGVEYSDDKIAKHFQRLFVRNLPLPEQWVGANTKINPYTGQVESFFSGEFFADTFSRYLPVKVSYPSVDKNEATAIGLGIKKSQLTGNYTVNNEKVQLNSNERTKLNVLYGKLNKTQLTKLYNGSIEVKVQTKDGTYKELKYSQMTDEQKKAAINNLMSNNGSLGKIYILTSTGKYRYYASDSEYEELRKLGITKNVYKKTDKKSGFIKIN